MSKKKKSPKNPVTIAGFDGVLGLKKDILKPLTATFKEQAKGVRPDEKINKGALNEFKSQITKLAADGSLDEKDLQRLQSFETSERGKHYEPLLRGESLTAALTDARYETQVDTQVKGFKDFRKQQTSIINKALSDQVSSIETFLGSMEADASSALGGFIRDLNKSTRATSREVRTQMRGFAQENQESRQSIRQAQRDIARLPKPPKATKQINDKISGVDSGDPFEKIGSNQAAIRVQTAPAMTGFSQAQQESRARQMQGLTGFRSSRA
jgi:hypothetical protein